MKEDPKTSSKKQTRKLGLIGLVGIIISAMIGGGVYNLPQGMAEGASAGSILLAWVITGIGIWFIANTFRILAEARPNLTNGLYTYAQSGFGKFVGFIVAYGYWICHCFALVAYSILIMDTINYFLPYFEGGNNIPAIIVGSVIVWLMFLLTLTGAKKTSSLNIIGTLGKLLPLVIFLILMLILFKFSIFFTDFWGVKDQVALNFSFENVLPQIKSTMMVTLWLFVGIEGAVIVSRRAKSQKTVRKSILIGFFATLILYILVSVLPFGIYTQGDLAQMKTPALAQIMLEQFGTWGEVIINTGIIIGVLSAWLIWLMMIGEMPGK